MAGREPVNKVLSDAAKGGPKIAEQLFKKLAEGKEVEVKKAIQGAHKDLERVMTPSDFNYQGIMTGFLQTIGIGTVPFSGELINPTKYMQQNQVPELISGAYSMIAALKNAGATGVAISPTAAFGGTTILNQVLAAAAKITSDTQKSNDELEDDTVDPLEVFLRALYRILEEKEPVDNDGVETAEYKLWRAEYILTLGNDFVDLYKERVGTP